MGSEGLVIRSDDNCIKISEIFLVFQEEIKSFWSKFMNFLEEFME